MADAVRLISIRRGYDPREFALVVFGGAGRAARRRAGHASSAIPTVLVPPQPGHHLGARLPARRRPPRPLRDVPRRTATTPTRRSSRREFAQLEDEARERLAAEGVPEDQMSLAAHDRHALPRPVALARGPGRRGRSTSTAPSSAFHAEHEREYSYRRDDAPVEIYRLTLRAIGVTPKAELAAARAATRRDAARAGRDAPGPLRRATSALRHAGLRAATTCRPGARSTGPAIVEQLDSTALVPPGVAAEVDEWLNIRMTIAGGAHVSDSQATALHASIPSPSRS